MSVYLIHKPGYKKVYYSFRRLLKEEALEEKVKKTGEAVPDKDHLPVRILYNQVTIERVEVDERI